MSNPLERDKDPQSGAGPSEERYVRSLDDLPTLEELMGIEEAEELLKDLDDWERAERHSVVENLSNHEHKVVNKAMTTQIPEKRTKLFQTGSKFAPVQRQDIVGIDNVLDQIDEVLDWLVNYRDYAKYRSRIEPGILFEGSPGTGKTYCSRHMATISDALFVDVRDFPYSGKTIGAQDIKDLFTRARKAHEVTNKPVILFWDEFEGVAKERGRQGVGPEQQGVISQLTAELDGVTGKPAGILLIGCTNYGDDIDGALRRPGRMGLQVEFNAPNRVGKARLLELYVSRLKTKGSIDCDTASFFFDDFDTAASVEEAVQQAWRFAVRRWVNSGRLRGGPMLTQEDLLEIFLKRLVGPPPAYSDVTLETLQRVSVHETGHALAATLLGVGLRLVTVRPGKSHLGKTMTYLADPRSSTMDELFSHLKVGVAGIVAEKIVGLPRGASASQDTRNVTEIAIDMVDMEAGGKRVGILNPGAMRKRFYNASPSISEKMIEDSDLDIKGLIDEAEKGVEELFQSYGPERIRKLAKRLIEVQTLTGRQFEAEVKKLV